MTEMPLAVRRGELSRACDAQRGGEKRNDFEMCMKTQEITWPYQRK